MSDAIIFDQYSRYRICADTLEKVSLDGATVIDVGSGEECLLGKFLPRFDITYVDPLLTKTSASDSRRIAGDVFVSELDERLFDYVVSVDTLEHVPVEKRDAFLDRISGLARKGVILACPCSDAGDAVETDRWLNEVYKLSRGADFSWLKEHREYGLPKLSETLKKLNDLGWQTRVTQNGHTPWLRELLGFILCGLDVPSLQHTIKELSEYFNRHLYPFDHHPPCYRQVIVAIKEKAPPLGKDLSDDSLKKAFHAWQYIQKRIHAYSTRVAYQQEAQISEQKLLTMRLGEELQQKDETLRVIPQLRDEIKQKEEALRIIPQLRDEIKQKEEALRIIPQLRDEIKQKEEALRVIPQLRDEIIRKEDIINKILSRVNAVRQSKGWRTLNAAWRFKGWITQPKGFRHTDPLEIKEIEGNNTDQGSFSFKVISYFRLNGLALGRWVVDSLSLSPRHRFLIKSLFYGIFGHFYRHTENYRAYLQEKRYYRNDSSSSQGRLPKLPAQNATDVFFWGVIDWHFRIQRPQHLASGIAAMGHRVFYFSPCLIKSPEAGFEIDRLDDSNRLFSVRLYSRTAPAIYAGACTFEVAEQLRNSMVKFLKWTHSQQKLSIVQHPFWFELVKSLTNNFLVYDCLDHQVGFSNNSEELSSVEKLMMGKADLVVVTSQWLYDSARGYNPNIALIRNGCDYEHFSVQPDKIYQDAEGQKIIGYYGAIADWFDLELVEKTAKHFSQCLILLIGADTIGAEDRLRRFRNVRFTGEVTYSQLSYYLYAMDVCMIPFKINPLTLATNPVKIYEFFCAGKPVVSVDLPEIRILADLVRVSGSRDEFLRNVELSLMEEPSDRLRAARKAFAKSQTWHHRLQELSQRIALMNDTRKDSTQQAPISFEILEKKDV